MQGPEPERCPLETWDGRAVAGWDGPRAGVQDDIGWIRHFGRRVALMQKSAEELEGEMSKAQAWASHANTARWGRGVARERALRALQRSDPDLLRGTYGGSGATVP